MGIGNTNKDLRLMQSLRIQRALLLLRARLLLALRRILTFRLSKAVGPTPPSPSKETMHCVLSQPHRDGGQAEYVRVPNADGTVMKAPPEIDDQSLILMADIFPTGYYGAKNAFTRLSADEIANGTVVVVGCGPVGVCAIIAALEYKPKHLFAVDSIESRLEQARKLGAEPLNFATDKEGMFERVRAVTDGRGADAVIEVVGLSPALRTAFDLIRPWGVISSIGVHNAEVSIALVVENRASSIRRVADLADRFRGQVTRRTSKLVAKHHPN